MSIRFHCQSCGKSITTADSSAGRHGKCPACGTAVEVPAAGPPDSPTPPATAPLTRTGRPATPPAPPPLTKTGRPATPPVPPPAAVPAPSLPSAVPRAAATPASVAPVAPSAAAGDAHAVVDGPPPAAEGEAREPFPWEIPPELWSRVEAGIAAGQDQRFPVQASSLLNTLGYADLKTDGFKLDLHVLPDCVAVTEREPLQIPFWLWLLIRGFVFLIMLPFQITALIGFLACAAVGVLVAFLLYSFLAELTGGTIALILCVLVLAGLIAGPLYLLRRPAWAQWAANVIRNKPHSWLAVLLLHWKSDIAPRVFRPGDVVQLLCAHPKTGWFSSRSLVVLVQDRPAPRRRGIVERLTPPFFARRRIFCMAFDGGEQAAEEAAKKAGQVLGLEVTRAVVERRRGLVIP